MNVPNILEIYTTYIGWIINNISVELIENAFWVFPFIFMVVNNVKESIGAGSFRAAADMALRRSEMDFYEKIIIILLFFFPVAQLDLSTVRYQMPTTNFLSFDPPETITVSNDPSSHSQNIGPAAQGLQAGYGDPKIGLVPYFFAKAFFGFNYTITKALQDVNARYDMAAADVALSTYGLNDPLLGAEMQMFVNDCYKKARSKYFQLAEERKIDPLLTAEGRERLEENPLDINYPGSVVFITTPGLYAACPDHNQCGPTLRASKPIEGWNYSAPRDGYRNEFGQSLPGQPYCSEWWLDLRDRIIGSAPEMQTIWGKVKTSLGISTTSFEQEQLTNRILLNSRNNARRDAPLIASTNTISDPNSFDEIMDRLSQIGISIGAVFKSFSTEGVKRAILIFLAIALLILYGFSPWILLATGFTTKGVVIVLGYMFTLIMGHSVIAIVEFTKIVTVGSVLRADEQFLNGAFSLDLSVINFVFAIAYPVVFVIYLSIMNSVVSALTGLARIGDGAGAVAAKAPPIPKK